MAKKKKLFERAKEEVKVEEIKSEPAIEEKVEEVVNEVVEEVIPEQPQEEVKEEPKEELQEEPKKEIILMINDIVEVNAKDLDCVPVRNDVFEFAGCEVKCIRNFGERVFIRILRRLK